MRQDRKITIRVSGQLRDRFVEAARLNGEPTSAAMKAMMRLYAAVALGDEADIRSATDAVKTALTALKPTLEESP